MRRRGKHQRITLEATEDFDAVTVRIQVRRLPAEVALDGLPRRAAQKHSPVFSGFVDEFWRNCGHHWKPSTHARNRDAIRIDLLPHFGGMRLDMICSSDIMRSSDNQSLSAQARAITLLLLTGCRRSEILSLQWSDLRGARLGLRVSKTGPRTVWLGQEAVDLLACHPRSRKAPGIFWNDRLHRPITNVHAAWCLVRDAAGLRDFRLHDLLHTFATHAAMNRKSLPMIGKLLGHRCIKSTARHAHLDDAHLPDAAEEIALGRARCVAWGCC